MIAQPFASRCTVLLALLLALPGAIGGCQSGNAYRFSVDFTYPGRGIGPHQRALFITLEPGMEDQMVARALITALQDIELSVRSLGPVEERAGDERCDPEWPIKYTTDIAVLKNAIIADYNAEFGRDTMRLPAGVIYGLKYKISYRIVNEQLDLSVCSSLYHKSLGADRFRSYEKNYSSGFFGKLLNTHLVSALKGPP